MKRTLLFAVLALAASAAVAAPAPYARTVDVSGPGWIRVALDGAAVAASSRWEVLGPNGARLPNTTVDEIVGERQLRVATVDESAEGWKIVFDAGVAPIVHDTFTLVLQADVVASSCRLEGSDDLERWAPLAEFGVFRIGRDERLQGRRASYPAAGWRFLRFSWPRSAGQPQLERATVSGASSARTVAAPVSVTRTTAGAGRVVLEVELPSRGAPLRRLVLEWANETPAYAVLYSEDHGRWRPLARYARETDSGRGAHQVAFLVEKSVSGRVLRIDVDGVGTPPSAARIELPPRWLVFRANEAGRCVIVARPATAGGGAGGELNIGQVTGPVAGVSVGPETSAPVSRLSSTATGRLPPGRMPRHWKAYPVLAPEATPGAVVAIDLPPSLLGTPGVGVDRLRPMVGDQTIPFAVERGATLERVEPALTPVTTSKSGEQRRAPLGLPADTKNVTQVELLAPSGAVFRAFVVATAVTTSRPGVEQRARIGAARWDCASGAAGRCSLLLDLDIVAPASILELELTQESGDVEIEAAQLWRVRDRIAFAWPGSGDVRLLAGIDAFEGWPSVPEAAAAELLAARALPASLDLGAQAEEAASLGRRGRLAVLLAVGLAAVVLLVVLARSLSRRGPATP